MTSREEKPELDRRDFLKSATVTGLSAGLWPAGAAAQNADTDKKQPPRRPGAADRAREEGVPEGYTEEEVKRYFARDPGSDYMVDVMKSLNIEYLAINPGSSFRGLQESVINYAGNERPKIITCLHEEQAGALAHGYAKVAGRPMAIACHSTVGTQHAAMAVYNAWADRVPIIVIGGNHMDAANRAHSRASLAAPGSRRLLSPSRCPPTGSHDCYVPNVGIAFGTLQDGFSFLNRSWPNQEWA